MHDEPWLAFCSYLGDLRSRIAVNVDLPISAMELLRLAMHETYPGHHAERCCKEQLLVRGQGLLEETIVLVPAPQSLVSEGIAELAPNVLLEGDGGTALAAVHARRRHRLRSRPRARGRARDQPLRWAEVNGALMFHEAGASTERDEGVPRALGPPEPPAGRPSDPVLQRADLADVRVHVRGGRELCRSYVAGEPERFRRLLTEQVRVDDYGSDVRFGAAPRCRESGLVLEECALHIEAAAVAGQSTVRTDEAVAREDDRDRIPGVGRPNRTCGTGCSESVSLLAVADRRAVRNRRQRRPRPPLERCPGQVQRKLELTPFAGKVLPQLPFHRHEQRVSPRHRILGHRLAGEEDGAEDRDPRRGS